jgi:uncharacterized membrane protein
VTISRSLLAVTTIVLGLSAGFFVTYQISVMPGLGPTDDLVFVRSMQSINATVRSAPFAVIFFGPLPLLVVTAVAFGRRRTIMLSLLATALLYGIGVLGVTLAGNVPLNEALASRLDPAEASAARAGFESPWLRLHAIRTGCVLVAFATVAVISALPPRRADA